MDNSLYLNLDITAEMAKGHILYLRPYLDAIARSVLNFDMPILEVGLGTGLCSIYLNQFGYNNVFGIDIDPKILAKFVNETQPMFDTFVKVFEGDAENLTDIIQELGEVHCIHHQGLLEHFENEERIIKVLDHHTQMSADVVVFAVPLDTYREESEYDHDEIRLFCNCKGFGGLDGYFRYYGVF